MKSAYIDLPLSKRYHRTVFRKGKKVKGSKEEKRLGKYQQTLEYQLCEALQGRAGERGHSEGAVDTLYRIIHERDQALLILGLDRLKEAREGRF